MNEVERRGIGKAKLGLAILTILAVILTASNIWVYVNLQNQIDSLETDNTTLHSQMGTLQTEKSDLESQISSLQTQVSNLQTNKSNLQSQISLLETWLDDNKTLLQTTINERNQLQTWLDDNVTDYESQIDTLNSQIDSLEAQITTLQNEIDLLEDEIFWLEWEIYWLKEPQLHKVEVYWADNHPLFATPYIDYYGNIFNSGSWTAYNVVITVRIYDASDTLLKTEQIHLGNIGGKSYQSFDVDIEYSGDADYVTSALSYD